MQSPLHSSLHTQLKEQSEAEGHLKDPNATAMDEAKAMQLLKGMTEISKFVEMKQNVR